MGLELALCHLLPCLPCSPRCLNSKCPIYAIFTSYGEMNQCNAGKNLQCIIVRVTKPWVWGLVKWPEHLWWQHNWRCNKFITKYTMKTGKIHISTYSISHILMPPSEGISYPDPAGGYGGDLLVALHRSPNRGGLCPDCLARDAEQVHQRAGGNLCQEGGNKSLRVLLFY